ncbi:hypothetical protein ACFU44_24675 [Nocardia rhizosphaerihabitans]
MTIARIDLDDDVLERVMAVSQTKTNSDAVNLFLCKVGHQHG